MRRSLLTISILSLLAAGCASARKVRPTDVIQAQTELPEEQLLDVAIQVFDPGLPEKMDKETRIKLKEEGVFPDIRKSESRYMPFHLKQTMQATGHWGAVRVVPKDTDSMDVVISATIVESTGRKLELMVRVEDATGEKWFERRYEQVADTNAYDEAELEATDPYQDLYNQLANDILDARDHQKPQELLAARRTSELRFAAGLAPDAFESYLSVDKKGRYRIQRLPAADDSMMARIEPIQERDNLLVDTLNEHYAEFYARMDESYDDWRMFSYEEQMAMRELRRSAGLRTFLGGLAILGAIVMETQGGSSAARDIAVLAGAAAIKSGLNKAAEAKIHDAALGELASSFDAEVSPMLVDVEDRTLKLSGSAETQYETWRKLLRGIFATETGLPLDPNTGTDATKTAPAGTAQFVAPSSASN